MSATSATHTRVCFVPRYNRNATISNNEFAWVGATCVASWGYSSPCLDGNCTKRLPNGWREGPDARGGEQVRCALCVGGEDAL